MTRLLKLTYVFFLVLFLYSLFTDGVCAQVQNKKKPTVPRTIAFKTKIESNNNDILKLENGGIVEVTYGYLGYIGYRKTCVLFRIGRQWKIWIEGKKAFKCDLLKAPFTRPIRAEEVYISEVAADGQILKMLDGSIYEVDSLDTINSSLWLGMSDALLLDDTELLNIDEGEIVTVTKLK